MNHNDNGRYGMIPYDVYYRKQNYPINLSVPQYNNNSYYPHVSPYLVYSESYWPDRVDQLGTRWDGQEKLWKWRWIRRGNSNVFDASYLHPHDPPFHATVFITITENQVIAQRRRFDEGSDCHYVGVIQGNTASGTNTCAQGLDTVWSAIIYGQDGRPITSTTTPTTTTTGGYEFVQQEVPIVTVAGRGIAATLRYPKRLQTDLQRNLERCVRRAAQSAVGAVATNPFHVTSAALFAAETSFISCLGALASEVLVNIRIRETKY